MKNREVSEKHHNARSVGSVDSERILYTPSAFASASLYHLQEAGTLRATRTHTSARKDLSSFLFFMVEDGSGELRYEGSTEQLKAGDCVFLNCRKPYSHTTSPDLWRLRFVHFDGAGLMGIYEKYRERGGRTVFCPDDPEAFRSILMKIYDVASGTDYVRDMLINQEIAGLLTLLMRESWHPDDRKEGTKKQNLEPLREYLEEHYREKIGLDELAERFFIGKFYLTRVFREHYGMSISQYLLNIRITKAKQMLRFTETKVEDIGYACGLGAPNYFSRTFRRVEGVSPAGYRKKWKSNIM